MKIIIEKKSTNQQQSSTNPRGRVHERKSGTGLDQGTKKNEALTENVGDPIKENMKSEELKKTEKEEESSSSEYFPEPDEEGEEKKDNIVRKGYNTYLEKLKKRQARYFSIARKEKNS